jgi:hypothetical protein
VNGYGAIAKAECRSICIDRFAYVVGTSGKAFRDATDLGEPLSFAMRNRT